MSEETRSQVSPDVIYCPHCKTAFERPKNRMTVQCPNEGCRAMVVIGTPSFARSHA